MRARGRRTRVLAALVLALAAGALAYEARREPAASPPGTHVPGPRPRLRLAELRHQPAGSLAGRVTSAGAPVVTATVCTRAGDAGEPACTPVAADGRWRIAELQPGDYAVWASAPALAGTAWRGPAPDLAPTVALAAGQARTGVDLVLAPGGALVRGVVHDVRGAPIAGAHVEVAVDAHAPVGSTTAGPDGAFTTWVAAGDVTVRASADGYVDNDVTVQAPDATVVVALTPGGALAGTVVDAATHEPVADADVEAGGEHARTDGGGAFRIPKLAAGRYKPTATAIGGYGETTESVRLGLGEHVSGLVIAIHPVAVVAGHIIADAAAGPQPCGAGEGEVWLSRYGGVTFYIGRTLDDGQILLEGVVPGTYEVKARCRHWLSRAPYPDVVVGDSDVDDLAWHVSPSARVAGRVRARSGEPIAGATVSLKAADSVSFGQAETGADGTFTADGLRPGAVTVGVIADGFLAPPAAVATAASATPPSCEVVLDRGGGIAGLVVDAQGQPLAGVRVAAAPVPDTTGLDGGGGRSDRTGAFTIGPLLPGAYRVQVDAENDDVFATSPAVDVTVAQNASAEVRLVATVPGGALEGRVVDGRGAPVTDAYVTALLEAIDDDGHAWRPHYTWTSPKRLVGADGSFHVGTLAPGMYSVRAARPGGGEATVAHLALGARATVVIQPTGLLAGVVVSASGAPVTDVVVTATDRVRDLAREERVYFTGGAFALRDLPAGDYKLTVNNDPRSAIHVTLADGAQRLDLKLVVQPRYELRGRVVSAGQPRAGWKVEVPKLETEEHSSSGASIETSSVEFAVTAADGTFVVHDLPAGTTEVAVFDATRPPDSDAVLKRDVAIGGAGPVVDAGDLTVP